MIILFPSIGALSNWLIRGGGIEAFTGRNLSGGRWIHAGIYGLCFALASGIWWYGPIAAGFMAIGQAPKWGCYIARIQKGEWLGALQLSVRGAFWGSCLALGGVLPDNGLYAFVCIVAGLMMGPVYWFMWAWIKQPWGNRFVNYWACSEQVFGFIIWAPLMVL